jgi:hypothetical protein
LPSYSSSLLLLKDIGMISLLASFTFPPSGRGNLASGLLCGVFSGGKMEEDEEEEMTGTRGENIVQYN